MNILIAPNSFKEVADSDKVAELFGKYLQSKASYSIETLPISDGGDGFLNVCKSIFNLETLNYEITTPYDETKLSCEVGYDPEGKGRGDPMFCGTAWSREDLFGTFDCTRNGKKVCKDFTGWCPG